MGGRGGSPNATTQAPTQQPATSASPEELAEQEIVAAYRQLRREPNDFVSLERIRRQLSPDLPREAVDRAMRNVFKRDGVNFVPENNQKSLTEAQRSASVRLGGQDKHLMSMEI